MNSNCSFSDDDLNRTLAYAVAGLRDAAVGIGKLREIVKLLFESKKAKAECYGRLVQAGVDKPQASRLASLATCEDAARNFLDGQPWEESVLAACRWHNSLKKTGVAAQPVPLDPRKKVAWQMAAMLMNTGRTELRHPKGVFRLVTERVSLGGSTGKGRRK